MNEFTSNDHIFKLEINNSTNRSAAELYNLLLSGNGNGGTLTTTVDHGNGQMPLTKTNLTEELFYDRALLDSNGEIDVAKLEQLNCVHISEAIAAQGIDDFTSYLPVQIGMGFAYALLLLFGLLSNGSVLWAFVRNRRLRSSRSFFLLNLIITDILLCLTAIPITPWYAMTKDWAFGPVMCRFVPLCNSCAVFVTSWSLTAIAFDKHMHIVVEPTRRHFSRQLAGFITFSIWFGSLVVNIPYLMSFDLVDGFYVVTEDHFAHFCGKFCDEFNWSSDGQRRFYGVVVLLFQFIIPMAVITFCHTRILRKVQKDMIVQNVQFRKTLTNSQRIDAISRKKRVNYTLLGMVFAFVGCNMPLTAVNLAKDFGQEPQFLLEQPYLWPLIAHLIAMSIVCWNPLLFYWLSGKDKSRGGSANGCLISLSEHQLQQQVGGTSTGPLNSLSVVGNVIRRWSRGDLPLIHCHHQQQLLASANGCSGTAAGNGIGTGGGGSASAALGRRSGVMSMSATRSHQLLSGRQSGRGGSFRRQYEGPTSNASLTKNTLENGRMLLLPPSTEPNANCKNNNNNNNNGIANGNANGNLLSLHGTVAKSNSIRSNLF